MIKFLTAVIGTVAKGSAAKAIAGGASTLIVGFEPLREVFLTNVVSGLEPAVAQLGAAIGAAIASYTIGHVITWLAPKNAG